MGQAGMTAILTPICECCLDVRNESNRALYRWTGPNGNNTNLCVQCCAFWQKNVKDDDSLTPQRIVKIYPIVLPAEDWSFE
jgi:hypothetical protein